MIKVIGDKREEKGKFDVGIVSLTKDIPQETVERFIASVKNDASPKIDCLIYLTSEKTDSIVNGRVYFNKNKGMNHGIRILAPHCEVVICADIDLLIPPGFIEISYFIARKQPYCGFIRKMPKGVFIENRAWNWWFENFSVAPFAFAPWNALRPGDWIKIGGWNENMYSWGYDEHIYDRMVHHGLDPYRRDIAPLVHVHHERRNEDARDIEPDYENKIKSQIGVKFL
jgi:hypothetical protein